MKQLYSPWQEETGSNPSSKSLLQESSRLSHEPLDGHVYMVRQNGLQTHCQNGKAHNCTNETANIQFFFRSAMEFKRSVQMPQNDTFKTDQEGSSWAIQ